MVAGVDPVALVEVRRDRDVPLVPNDDDDRARLDDAVTKLTEEAVLSPMNATFVGFLPVAFCASSMTIGSICPAWRLAVGEDWKTCRKPRPVIRSE